MNTPLPDQLPRRIQEMEELASRLEDPEQVIQLLERLETNRTDPRNTWAPAWMGQKTKMRRLKEAVARQIPHPSQRLQDYMQTHLRLEAGRVGNANLEQRQARKLLNQAWQATQNANFQDDIHSTNSPRLEDSFFWGCDVLKAWDQHRQQLPPAMQEEIFLSVIHEGQLDLRVHKADEIPEEKYQDFLAHRREVKRYRMVGQHIKNVNPEVLETLREQIKDDPRSALHLITLPMATQTFAAELSFHQKERGTINASLDQFPQLAENENFYQMARNVRDPFVHAFLLEQTNSPEQGEKLLKELIDINPNIAANGLHDFCKIPGAHLNPQLLSRLLKQADPEYRPEIMRTAHVLQSRDSTPKTPKR